MSRTDRSAPTPTPTATAATPSAAHPANAVSHIATDTTSLDEVHRLIPRYFFRYLGYAAIVAAAVFSAGMAVHTFLPNWPISREDVGSLLEVNTLTLSALGVSISLVGVLVTYRIAHTALLIANSATVLTQLDYERETQKATNDLYAEVMATTRRMAQVLRSTQQQAALTQLPRHWWLLMLWQLDNLQHHGEVWGAGVEDPALQDRKRAQLLQMVGNYLASPHSDQLDTDERAALLRLQAALPLHPAGTQMDMAQALQDCQNTALLQQYTQQLQQLLQQWQQAIEAIETSPVLFGIYRQTPDAVDAFVRLRDHVDNLLGSLGSAHRGHHNDNFEHLVRAQLLWLAYLRHQFIDFWPTHTITPFVCLLSQQNYAVSATLYARAPGAAGMAQALHQLLQPLQYPEATLRQLAKMPSLQAPDAGATGRAMVLVPPIFEEVQHHLQTLHTSLAAAHRDLAPVFDRIDTDRSDSAMVEDGLQRWRWLARSALYGEDLPAAPAKG